MTDFPVLVHAGLSYALIGMGLALGLRGLRIFCGQDLSWKWIAAITLVSFLLPAYFAQLSPDKGERLAATGLLFGSFCWVCAATLLRGIEGNSRKVMWASVGGFSAIGLILILRGLYLFVLPAAALEKQTIATIADISLLARCGSGADCRCLWPDHAGITPVFRETESSDTDGRPDRRVYV